MSFLRKLTADYTEAEYQAYLMSEPEIDTSKDGWHHNYAEIEQLDGSFKYIPEDKVICADWDNLPEITGDESLVEIVGLLTECAKKTGYEPEFVCKQYFESVVDYVELGESIEYARSKAFYYTTRISWERDW